MKNTASYVVCVSLCLGAPAWSAEWQPQLLAGTGKTRGPSDPIRIQVPKTVKSQLAIEVDGMDVTAMVSKEAGTLVFIPPQPLSFGEHELRVVEYAANGDIIERGVWKLEIRQSVVFREGQLEVPYNLNLASRVEDHNLSQPAPNSFNASGSARVNGRLADAGWSAVSQLDLIYNNRETLMPRGAKHGHVDSGYFLLGVESGPVVAQVGHHAVGPDSLVMQGFNRRGVSAAFQSDDKQTAFTAFTMSTPDLIGFQRGFGVGQSPQRSDGAVFTHQIQGKAQQTFNLSGTYVNGQGSPSGVAGSGIAGDNTISRGHAIAVMADAVVMERRLRLRGELAKSNFDADGNGRDVDGDGTIDNNEDSKDSRAHTLFVSYTPWHDKVVDGQPLYWTYGMENRRIGTHFRSIANPGAINDRNMLRGFGNLNWSGMDLHLSLARETDNVDHEVLLPESRSLQTFIGLTYSPLYKAPANDGQPPPLPWYGQPTYNFTYLSTNQDVTQSGGGLTRGALRDMDVWVLGANFVYHTWNWTLQYNRSVIDEHANLAADTYSQLWHLSANFRIGDKLTLTPSIQISDVDERNPPSGFTERDADTMTNGLAIAYQFTDKVTAALGYNQNREKISNNAGDSTTRDMTASVSWMAAMAQGSRPGVTVSLDGAWHDRDDRITLSNNQYTYQIFLKVAVSGLLNF